MRQGAARSSGFRREVHAACRANAPFVLIVTLYAAVGVVILRGVGQSVALSFADTYRMPVVLALTYVFLTALVAVVGDFLFGAGRPGDLQEWFRLYQQWFGTRRLVGTLLVLAFLPPLMSVMLGFRQALTVFHPFSFDPELMRLDAWLHFGRHPWEWLQPLLGSITATVFIDRIYVFGWFFLLWAGVVWQAVHGREPLRLQFFLAFALSWIILGTVAATLFSSAGPIYFGRVTELADPYSPMVTFLHSVGRRSSLHALEIQESLWLNYRARGGITAMPSMHLAITTVVALTAARTHRWMACVVGPLWILILLGSVHLGWHYAVDSYAGILGGLLIWLASGSFSRWWLGRTQTTVVDA